MPTTWAFPVSPRPCELQPSLLQLVRCLEACSVAGCSPGQHPCLAQHHVRPPASLLGLAMDVHLAEALSTSGRGLLRPSQLSLEAPSAVDTSWELAAASTCTPTLCSLLRSELLAEVVFGAVSQMPF